MFSCLLEGILFAIAFYFFGRGAIIFKHKKKIFTIFIGITVTVVCLYLALKDVKWAEIRDSFRKANYATLPPFLLILAVFYWLKAIRWRMLLEPQKKLTTRQVLPTVMIGFMGNNLLPFRMGELIRTYLLARKENLSKAGVLSTLVLERVFDLASVLFYLILGLSFFPELGENSKIPQDKIPYFLAVITIFFLILTCYIIFTKQFVSLTEWFLGKMFFLPESLKSKLLTLLHVGETGIASLRSPRILVLIILNSLAQWFLNGLLVLLALYSFGLPYSLPIAFLVLGVTAIAVALPSTPGFFGVIQYCFQISLAPFGVSSGEAFSCSIYFHLSQWIPVTLIGLFFLHRIGIGLGELSELESQAAKETTEKATEEFEGFVEKLPSESESKSAD